MAVIVNSYKIVHWIEVFYLPNSPVIFKLFPISSYSKHAIFAMIAFFFTPWILSRRLKIAWPKNRYSFGLLTYISKENFFFFKLHQNPLSVSIRTTCLWSLERKAAPDGDMGRESDLLAPKPEPRFCEVQRFCVALFPTDRAVDNSVGPLRCHHCRKRHRAALNVEEEEEVENDLLCDSAGRHRWETVQEGEERAVCKIPLAPHVQLLYPWKK